MTTKDSYNESDGTPESPAAESPEARAAPAHTPPSAPLESPRAREDKAAQELEELLTKLENPELASIRHLFNMC